MQLKKWFELKKREHLQEEYNAVDISQLCHFG